MSFFCTFGVSTGEQVGSRSIDELEPERDEILLSLLDLRDGCLMCLLVAAPASRILR